MTLFTMQQVAQLTGGQLRHGEPATAVERVVHDSRLAEPGAMFVAIVGERVDGHDFAAKALADGAAGVLVSRWEEPVPPGPGAVCVVPDTVRALGQLAHFQRRRFEPVVWGITGSTGKTTTKEMAVAVLGCRYSVHSNPGNLNTEVGLPLSLFHLSEEHQLSILEMGARRRGDIALLCRLAEPARAIITNVGQSHLEVFGSLEAVARGKGELVEYLGPDGVACLNGDDRRVREMAGLTPARVVLYGRSSDCEIRASDEWLDDRACPIFTLEIGGASSRVRLPVPGTHQVSNALAAAAAGHVSGLTLDEISHGLEVFDPPAMRMSVLRLGNLTVIDDTYNASPDSGRAALNTLSRLAGGVKVAILGDMLELGEAGRQAHIDLGALAVEAGVDLLVTMGDMAGFIREGALQHGLPPERAVHYRSVPPLLEDLPGLLGAGGHVLVKGSRGMKMEQIVAAVRSWEVRER